MLHPESQDGGASIYLVISGGICGEKSKTPIKQARVRNDQISSKRMGMKGAFRK